jgi:hypothetical protein
LQAHVGVHRGVHTRRVADLHCRWPDTSKEVKEQGKELTEDGQGPSLHPLEPPSLGWGGC